MTQTIKIEDNKTTPIKELRAVFEENITTKNLIYDGTMNDLDKQIDRETKMIDGATERKRILEIKKTALQEELNKLPSRIEK